MDLTRFCPVLLFLAAAVCFFCVAAHEDQAEQGVNSVKVGSFNLQVFGVAKFSKQDVVSQLVQVSEVLKSNKLKKPHSTW